MRCVHWLWFPPQSNTLKVRVMVPLAQCIELSVVVGVEIESIQQLSVPVAVP